MDAIFKEAAQKFFVGRTFQINYDQVNILTTDKWKRDAGGIPKGCFLLAFFIGQEDKKQEALLLRALGPTMIPSTNDHVASMIDYYKDSYHYKMSNDPSEENTPEKIDPYTKFEFSVSGLRCRILGSFYRINGSPIKFGADVENFYSPNNYQVYKAVGKTLQIIVNQRDGPNQTEFKIGKVRYSSTQLIQLDSQRDVEVSISSIDFLGKRTALFGMTRTGKSNTIKKIIQATVNLSKTASSDLSTPNQVAPHQ